LFFAQEQQKELNDYFYGVVFLPATAILPAVSTIARPTRTSGHRLSQAVMPGNAT
jgi:hypothetical protein